MKTRQTEACIYGCRIIKRKSVFFLTCEQIGLFLISTRGCGSHSWKLLKSPICSRVQLIPNCFTNRPISYHQIFLQLRKLTTVSFTLNYVLKRANDSKNNFKLTRFAFDLLQKFEALPVPEPVRHTLEI